MRWTDSKWKSRENNCVLYTKEVCPISADRIYEALLILAMTLSSGVVLNFNSPPTVTDCH